VAIASPFCSLGKTAREGAAATDAERGDMTNAACGGSISGTRKGGTVARRWRRASLPTYLLPERTTRQKAPGRAGGFSPAHIIPRRADTVKRVRRCVAQAADSRSRRSPLPEYSIF